ncbi:MAG: hypothetical protein U5K33_10155 [Halofilum sp. (in: g-proteobacteria)]|nr:hypothetical protein [Halofilum sp. (in: g-proteobacteria)]
MSAAARSSATEPQTLWRPPEIGSSALAASDRAGVVDTASTSSRRARAFDHERAGTVVQEGGIGVARGAGDRRVALVTGAADRVEALVARPHRACLVVQVPRQHLRLEQFEKAGRVQSPRIGQHGIRAVRAPAATAAIDEGTEIRIDDLDTIDWTGGAARFGGAGAIHAGSATPGIDAADGSARDA